MEITTSSASETEKIGQRLAAYLTLKDLICLYGPLGSGKTTFVRGLAKGLGVKRLPTSPSYVLIQEYKLKDKLSLSKKLYHVDLYRLEKIEEIEKLGLKSLFNDKKTTTVIEWAEKAKNILPQMRIDIFFYYQNFNSNSRKLCLVDKTDRNVIDALMNMC